MPIPNQTARAGTSFGTPLPVTLLARTNFSPFVDSSLPGGGIASTIVQHAFVRAGYQPTLNFSGWEGDTRKLIRVNFPYEPSRAREADHLYSTPILGITVTAYSHRDRAHRIEDLIDLLDLRVCASQAVHAQAAWAAGTTGDGLFTRIEGDAAFCFRQLMKNAADVVLIGLFDGDGVIQELGIASQLYKSVNQIELGGLHILIPKFSSHSSAMMYRLNAALDDMRQTGETQAIVELFVDRPDSTGPSAPTSSRRDEPPRSGPPPGLYGDRTSRALMRPTM